MLDTWETIFDEMVEDRLLKIERFSLGGYKVSTTKGSDDTAGVLQTDGSRHVFPVPARGIGAEIIWDVESLAALRDSLISDGEFSEEAADKTITAIS